MNLARTRTGFLIFTVFSLLTLAVTAPVYAQSFHLYSASNSNIIPTNTIVLDDNETAINPVLPVIAMTNVPLSQGILRLLRQCQMQFTIDPRLEDWWTMTGPDGNRIHEPMLNFRWTNMTAGDALYRVLKEHHLAVVQGPLTLDSRITFDGDFDPAKDIGFFANGSNAGSLIQFKSVPLTVALYNLAQQARINYIFDPTVGYGDPDKYGQLFMEPEITLRVTNVTAEQVFRSLCVRYDFVIVRDPRTSVTFVRCRDHDLNFVTAEVYGNDTDAIPMIEFKDVPISLALKNLARQARLKCILSPRIDLADQSDEPTVSLCWKNITAAQALAGICENYDFDVIKYPVSGFIRVEPDY
jgi:hypothetical protein